MPRMPMQNDNLGMTDQRVLQNCRFLSFPWLTKNDLWVNQFTGDIYNLHTIITIKAVLFF